MPNPVSYPQPTDSQTHLVVGADGLIGHALMDYLQQQGQRVVGTTRRSDRTTPTTLCLDLSQDLSTWQPPAPIAVAYLCAAVTSIAQCRQDPQLTQQINVEASVALGRTLVKQGAFVVFLSSTAVFDGTVPDVKADAPITSQREYGLQKAAAEQQLLALGESVAVVRFSKVVGADMPLLQGWLRSLRAGEPIHPFTDLGIAPVPVSLAVQALYQIAQHRLPGIIQISGQRDVSYAEVAHYLARRIGADPSLVQPRSAHDVGFLPADITPYTTLDTTRLQTELGITPPEVWSTLDAVLGLESGGSGMDSGG